MCVGCCVGQGCEGEGWGGRGPDACVAVGRTVSKTISRILSAGCMIKRRMNCQCMDKQSVTESPLDSRLPASHDVVRKRASLVDDESSSRCTNVSASSVTVVHELSRSFAPASL